MKKVRDYYAEIDTALKSYENYKPWHDKSIDWICNRISWCHKWKKISENQMQELSDRAIAILER